MNQSRINMKEFLDTINYPGSRTVTKEERKEQFLAKYNLSEDDYSHLLEKVHRNQFEVIV